MNVNIYITEGIDKCCMNSIWIRNWITTSKISMIWLLWLICQILLLNFWENLRFAFMWYVLCMCKSMKEGAKWEPVVGERRFYCRTHILEEGAELEPAEGGDGVIVIQTHTHAHTCVCVYTRARTYIHVCIGGRGRARAGRRGRQRI